MLIILGLGTETQQSITNAMLQIGEWCTESATTMTADEALAAAEKIRYPVIICAVYALGGLGTGFAQNEMELWDTPRHDECDHCGFLEELLVLNMVI